VCVCVCNLYICTFAVVCPLFTGVILSHSVSSHEPSAICNIPYYK